VSVALDQVQEAVAILDPHSGAILHANAPFLRTFGQGGPWAPGQALGDFFRNDDERQLLINTLGQARTGQAWAGRLFLGTQAETTVLFEMTLSPVQNDEGVAGALVLRLRDVSTEAERDRHLRQAQKLNTLGALAGGVAHDFNNLIGAILVAAENIEAQIEPGSPLRKGLGIIQQAGGRAKELTAQILDFYRHSENTRPLLDLTSLTAEVVSLLQTSVPGNVRVQSDVAEGIRVFGDASQLHQVIMNLGINASQSMQPAGGTLSIRLRQGVANPRGDTQAYSESCVQLTVEDTGCGMAPQIQAHIFEPFFTTKEVGRGTGLGLSVVHDIIQKHGGAIHVTSTPGQGSSFDIFLPVKQDRRRVLAETRVSDPQRVQEGA
jgi:signal transduction histidine kinase